MYSRNVYTSCCSVKVLVLHCRIKVFFRCCKPTHGLRASTELDAGTRYELSILMVDNGQAGARRADDVAEETTPLACRSSSGPASSHGQDARLSITDTAAGNDCQSDADVSAEDEKTITCAPSADTSDDLRHIVIDGSNVAMRLV